MAAPSELTPRGSRMLRDGAAATAALTEEAPAVAAQLLGVYRYASDEEARRVLPREDVERDDADIFDLLLSDGERKTKCVLSQRLNRLVRQDILTAMTVVNVTRWEVVAVPVDDQDGGTTRPVVVAQAIEVQPQAEPSQAKIVHAPASSSRTSSPSEVEATQAAADVSFLSSQYAREHAAIPLIGARLYYLPLRSDKFPFFEEPSRPLELTPAQQVEPWLAWNERRRYCTDLFANGEDVVHTLEEVSLMTNSKKRKTRAGGGAAPMPRVLGVVQFKSQLVHLGNPDNSNAFPFMFHIIIADKVNAIELAFFGSMAAQYFLVVNEGDVIQVEQYSVARCPDIGLYRDEDHPRPKKMYFFPHLSHGVVSHIPERYWKLLEATEVLPEPQGESSEDEQGGQNVAAEPAAAPAPRTYLDCTFLTTLDTQEWVIASDDEQDATFFDYVGVVSFAGRVYCDPQQESAHCGELCRWIKVIDSSSCSEMAVKLRIGGQPDAFRTIRAGDVVMLTRLSWMPPARCVAEPEHATTSVFSTLRLNDAVTECRALEEVKTALDFLHHITTRVRLHQRYGSSPVTTESWLEGPPMENYRPTIDLPSERDAFAATFGLQTLSLRELDALCEQMVSFEQRHVLVRARLLHISSREGPSGIETELEIGDVSSRQHRRNVRVTQQPLFRVREIPSAIQNLVAPDAIDLLRLLPPAQLEDLSSTHAPSQLSFETPQRRGDRSSTSSTTSTAPASTSTLSLEQVVAALRSPNATTARTFSVHLYRAPDGSVDAQVDTIFA